MENAQQAPGLLYGRQAVVTKHAIVQRINRKLKPDWKQLKKTRGRYLRAERGDYYVLNIYRNVIVTNECADPETLGRKLGVIADWETVVDGGGA